MTEDKGGLAAGHPRPETPFDTYLREALAKVVDVEKLKDDYVDPGDRARVHSRKVLTAVMDAIADYYRQWHVKYEDGSVDIPVDPSLAPFWSVKFQLRHDFAHLDAGQTADFLLRAADPTSIDVSKNISHDRKALIYWLATIEVWERQKNGRFGFLKDVIDFAAQKTGRSAQSINTERSNFKNKTRCSDEEYSLYTRLIYQSRKSARASSGARTAFELMLPAAVLLSDAPPKPASANKI